MNISNIPVPKDILKRFEDSCNKIQKRETLFAVKQLIHSSIGKENNDNLALKKLTSDLRDVFRFKELYELYIRFPEKQLEALKKANPTAQQLLDIKSTIEGVSITSESGSQENLSIEKFVKLPSSTVPESEQSESKQPESKQPESKQPESKQPQNEQSKKSDTIEFSTKEKKRVEAAYKKVKKLVNNYNSKNKKGQSRTLVYNKKRANEDIPPEKLKAIAINFHLFSYFRGCKDSTKIIKKYNEFMNFIEKYGIEIPTNILDDKTKKNLVIPMPKGLENTTYLEDLRIILERNKKQYEETLELVKERKRNSKRRNADSSIKIRDEMRTIKKFTGILKNFITKIKELVKENPKYSESLKKEVTIVTNLYESSTKMCMYRDSYKEIKYDMYFGNRGKDLLFFSKEIDTYKEHIYDLIITATKAKSMKKVANCVSVLHEDYNDCTKLKEKLSDFAAISQAEVGNMTREEALEFERKFEELAKQAGVAIGPLQRGMGKLQKFLENQKEKNSIKNKLTKTATGVSLIANIAASLVATVNGII